MDELELAVEYPLGTALKFRRTDRNALGSGIVNGAPLISRKESYVPIYVDGTGEIIYVNTRNIIAEDA